MRRGGKMKKETSIFKRIHTDQFKWTDSMIYVFLSAFVIMILGGQILGLLLIEVPLQNQLANDETGFWETLCFYLVFIGIWIVTAIYLLIFKRNRHILKAAWTTTKGNNLKLLSIGFLIGFGLNIACAIAAMLNKDISIYFNSIQPVKLIIILIAVFIQSSAEELVCRGYVYQALRRGYRHPAVAIVFSSLFFAGLHLLNPGIGILPVIDLFLSGLMFAFIVYYMDSLWAAMAAHTAWNYTQNIILGLPNSGNVTPFSIFKLDAASASDSFAYSIDFGLEGTLFAITIQALTCLAIYLIYRNKVTIEPQTE